MGGLVEALEAIALAANAWTLPGMLPGAQPMVFETFAAIRDIAQAAILGYREGCSGGRPR